MSSKAQSKPKASTTVGFSRQQPEPALGSRSFGDSDQVPSEGEPLGQGTGGRPLPEPVRHRMEKAFGHNFSQVRIHEGPEALEFGAEAFTRREHIHFAPGQYRPVSSSGQALIGHELAHVVQQRTGRVAAPAPGTHLPVNVDPALEAEADRTGPQAAHGLKVAIPGSNAPVTSQAGLASKSAVQPSFASNLRIRWNRFRAAGQRRGNVGGRYDDDLEAPAAPAPTAEAPGPAVTDDDLEPPTQELDEGALTEMEEELEDEELFPYESARWH